MIKKMQWNWERLDANTYRAKVIGGWIVLHCGGANSCSDTLSSAELKKLPLSESMVFMPDRDHEWTIVTPKADIQVEKSALAKDFEAKS